MPDQERRKLVWTEEEKEALMDGVREIKIILTGNGHPEEGLVYKTQRNTEFRVFWERFGWLILAGFAGIPCTIVGSLILNAIAKRGV